MISPKQQRFVDEYLVDLNATQAAIRAGYSKRTAAEQAHDLLRKPQIQALVDEALARRAERVEVKADDVLRELLRLGMSDPAGAFSEDGSLLPIRKMPVEVRRAISSIEVRTDETGVLITKVKWWDKVKGLDLLGRHLRLFVERTELTGAEGGPLAVTDTTTREVLDHLRKLAAKTAEATEAK